MNRTIITLTTDYGTQDHYVAALKGVILSIAPDVHIVDVTHDIEPYDITSGAFVLRQTWNWFPAGTIHVTVVDPGVGTSRRILLARYAGSYVVAPDNGLVSFVHQELPSETIHVVENPRFMMPKISATFHGRDVLAPVAAHLARGVAPPEFGPTTKRCELLEMPYRAVESDGVLIGRILHVDRFGTLVTNIHAEQLLESSPPKRTQDVSVDGQEIGPIRTTFSDVSVGETLALLGGGGFLEIAVSHGRAIDRFARSSEVRVG